MLKGSLTVATAVAGIHCQISAWDDGTVSAALYDARHNRLAFLLTPRPGLEAHLIDNGLWLGHTGIVDLQDEDEAARVQAFLATHRAEATDAR